MHSVVVLNEPIAGLLWPALALAGAMLLRVAGQVLRARRPRSGSVMVAVTYAHLATEDPVGPGRIGKDDGDHEEHSQQQEKLPIMKSEGYIQEWAYRLAPKLLGGEHRHGANEGNDLLTPANAPRDQYRKQ